MPQLTDFSYSWASPTLSEIQSIKKEIEIYMEEHLWIACSEGNVEEAIIYFKRHQLILTGKIDTQEQLFILHVMKDILKL